jgi:hypothetical protein
MKSRIEKSDWRQQSEESILILNREFGKVFIIRLIKSSSKPHEGVVRNFSISFIIDLVLVDRTRDVPYYGT